MVFDGKPMDVEWEAGEVKENKMFSLVKLDADQLRASFMECLL